MGGAVSTGANNDELVSHLIEAKYIKSPEVERVFRLVDRRLYYTKEFKSRSYRDAAWKDGNLHLSAPCIYSVVMENLNMKEGMSFLNIGSGTGYLSTMAGLILGKNGVNHGIELYEDVVQYAREKLDEFLGTSKAIDLFEFCEPIFVVGNCFDLMEQELQKRYDRIYCGAACLSNEVAFIIDLLKVGGFCIVPVGQSLFHIQRLSECRQETKVIQPVTFASLIHPMNPISPASLPEKTPLTLTQMCRSEIRCCVRKSLVLPEINARREELKRAKKKNSMFREGNDGMLMVQNGPRDTAIFVHFNPGRVSASNRRQRGRNRMASGNARTFRHRHQENPGGGVGVSSVEKSSDRSPFSDLQERAALVHPHGAGAINDFVRNVPSGSNPSSDQHDGMPNSSSSSSDSSDSDSESSESVSIDVFSDYTSTTESIDTSDEERREPDTDTERSATRLVTALLELDRMDETIARRVHISMVNNISPLEQSEPTSNTNRNEETQTNDSLSAYQGDSNLEEYVSDVDETDGNYDNDGQRNMGPGTASTEQNVAGRSNVPENVAGTFDNPKLGRRLYGSSYSSMSDEEEDDLPYAYKRSSGVCEEKNETEFCSKRSRYLNSKDEASSTLAQRGSDSEADVDSQEGRDGDASVKSDTDAHRPSHPETSSSMDERLAVFSNQMELKIQSLPLPPPLKIYLNYGREFQSTPVRQDSAETVMPKF